MALSNMIKKLFFLYLHAVALPEHQNILDKLILRLLHPESELYHNPFQKLEKNIPYDRQCYNVSLNKYVEITELFIIVTFR